MSIGCIIRLNNIFIGNIYNTLYTLYSNYTQRNEYFNFMTGLKCITITQIKFRRTHTTRIY